MNRQFISKRTGILFLLLLCSALFLNCSGPHLKIPPNGLDVPFYNSFEDQNQCMQMAMKSVIAYFLGEVYSLDELDKITGRRKGKWTTVSQGVVGLYEVGLDVEGYCAPDEPDIRKRWGADAQIILENVDMAVVNEYAERAAGKNLIQKRRLHLYQIEAFIEEGSVPIMIVDSNVLLGKEGGPYNGHLVVVTGFDGDSIYYHEPGRFPLWASPHRRVPKKVFIKAWNANGTDNCAIIVFGKRKKTE